MALDLSKLTDAVTKVAGIAAANKALQDEHTAAQADIDKLTAALLDATTSPAAAVGIAAVAAALAPVAPASAPNAAPVAPAVQTVGVVSPVAPAAPATVSATGSPAPLTLEQLNAQIAARNAAANAPK
jgi:hypothetical protein